jgi:spermidine/putrescine-binding protein
MLRIVPDDALWNDLRPGKSDHQSNFMVTTMRAFVRTSLAAVVLVSSASGACAAEKLTISVWGGSYGETWKKEVVEPFIAKTGIEVTLDTGPASQRLSKLIAARGGADLVLLTDHQMAVAKQRGLFEPVNPANVPNLNDLHDFAKDPLKGGLCPANVLIAVGIAYNQNQLAAPPKSWKCCSSATYRPPPPSWTWRSRWRRRCSSIWRRRTAAASTTSSRGSKRWPR